METVELPCDFVDDPAPPCGLIVDGSDPCIVNRDHDGWCVDEDGRTWQPREWPTPTG